MVCVVYRGKQHRPSAFISTPYPQAAADVENYVTVTKLGLHEELLRGLLGERFSCERMCDSI